MTTLKDIANEAQGKSEVKRLTEEYAKRKSGTSRFVTSALGFIRSYGFTIIVQIISFIILGLDKFIVGTWSWAMFANTTLWSRFITFQTANILSVLNMYSNTIKKLKDTELDYVGAKAEIQTIVNKDDKTPFISKGVEIEDWERKKEAHIDKYEYKKFLISKWHKIDDLRAFQDNPYIPITTLRKNFIALGFCNLRNFLGRLKNARIKKKLKLYDNYLSQDFIEETLPSLKVRYNKVTRELLIGGIQPQKTDRKRPDFLPHSGKNFMREWPVRNFGFSLLILILLSIAWEEKNATVIEVFIFSFQALILVYNTYDMINFAKINFINSHLKAMLERKDQLKKFEKQLTNLT